MLTALSVAKATSTKKQPETHNDSALHVCRIEFRTGCDSLVRGDVLCLLIWDPWELGSLSYSQLRIEEFPASPVEIIENDRDPLAVSRRASSICMPSNECNEEACELVTTDESGIQKLKLIAGKLLKKLRVIAKSPEGHLQKAGGLIRTAIPGDGVVAPVLIAHKQAISDLYGKQSVPARLPIFRGPYPAGSVAIA